MNYTLPILKDRAEMIVNSMNNETKIMTQPDSKNFVNINIEIKDALDLLNLYHAGITTAISEIRKQ